MITLDFIWTWQEIFDLLVQIFKEHLCHSKAYVILITFFKQFSCLEFVVDFVLLSYSFLVFVLYSVLKLPYSLSEYNWVILHLIQRNTIEVDLLFLTEFFCLRFKLSLKIEEFLTHARVPVVFNSVVSPTMQECCDLSPLVAKLTMVDV